MEEDGSQLSENPSASLKRFALSLGDFGRIAGPIKMTIEAVRGRTMDGFDLKPAERAFYATAVGSNVWSFYLLYDLMVNKDFAFVAAMTPVCQGTYYGSMFAGKLRNTGSIFTQDCTVRRTAAFLRDAAVEFIWEE